VVTTRSIPKPVALAKQSSDEESEPIEVIDLTPLPMQRAEPVPLPELPPEFLEALAVKKTHAEENPVVPTPVVPEFLPLAADGDLTPSTANASPTWAKIVRFVWGLPEKDSSPAGPAYDPIMPTRSSYHQDHPVCPYTGGCPYDGSQYRRSAIAGDSKPGGDEVQDTPTKKNAPKRKTMDIRPGELPMGWFWQPY
jgi:hypothetical protein